MKKVINLIPLRSINCVCHVACRGVSDDVVAKSIYCLIHFVFRIITSLGLRLNILKYFENFSVRCS